jgi:hypothetical protein
MIKPGRPCGDAWPDAESRETSPAAVMPSALKPRGFSLARVRALLLTPATEVDHPEHGNGLRPQAPAWRDTHRVVVTAWLLALTGILLAYGYWGWGLVTLAGAAANSFWACRVYRATMR